MVCSPGDPCIAGDNGKADKKSGDPAGYDHTGAEPYKAEKNILKHKYLRKNGYGKENCLFKKQLPFRNQYAQMPENYT